MNQNPVFSLLVPIDFTEKSLHAIEYAANMVKKQDGIVHLLHIVDERIKPQKEEVEAIQEKTIKFATEQNAQLEVNIIPNVVTGNIFISIGKSAKKLGVQLIVMGIHGMHGIQLIIGSFAKRVILGSQVPVLLINGSKGFSGFKKIVLPFDQNLNMEHLVNKSIEFGNIFNSNIYLFSKNEEDSFWKKRSLNAKIRKTLKQIRKSGLHCESVSNNSKDEDTAESILNFAEKMEADLIMLTTQSKQNSKNYYILDTVTSLMEKSKTPLCCINTPLQKV